MWKTIRHVIPHSFSFQVNSYDMPWLDKVFVRICIFVPSTADTTADHTDPDIVFFLAIIAVRMSLVRLVMVFVVWGGWKLSVHLVLFSVLGENSTCGAFWLSFLLSLLLMLSLTWSDEIQYFLIDSCDLKL